jgi:hypothetical protein
MGHTDLATTAEVYAWLVLTDLRVAYQAIPDIPVSAGPPPGAPEGGEASGSLDGGLG